MTVQETAKDVENYFENVTKSISNATLNNSRVMARRSAPNGEVYTLVGMDQATYDLNFNKIVEKASEKDNGLWKEFKNKKTSEALDNVLSKLQK
jgi:NADPH-dependent curcumin reductase CurA